MRLLIALSVALLCGTAAAQELGGGGAYGMQESFSGTFTGSSTVPDASCYQFTTGGKMCRVADGEFAFSVLAGTSGIRLNSLTPTSAFPAIGQSGSNLYVRVFGTGNSFNVQDVNGNSTADSFLGRDAQVQSGGQFKFSSTSGAGGTADMGIKRLAAGVASPTNGSSGAGDFSAAQSVVTAGTMTNVVGNALMRNGWTCRTWANADVVALGATTAGDIAFGTLTAKAKVLDATVTITGTAAGVTTLTVAVGRTSATYIDYIVASDAKAAANTVYGDASAERGTNLTGYDLPSWTGTTLVNAHFISTGANLSAVTGSTGQVCLLVAVMP